MTFQQSHWATDGSRTSGQLARLMLRSATNFQEGIISPQDLRVEELATPGSSVRILDGECVVLGDAVADLGTYYGYNQGQHELPIASTGAGETRSDLIIVQAQDPTYAGSPFTGDPATDVIVTPRVVAGVSPDATETSEVNAIVLARVDVPESTTTITQDMILDLREIANPPTKTFQFSKENDSGVVDTLTEDTFVNWPDFYGSLTFPVPTWATHMDVAYHIYGIDHVNDTGSAAAGDSTEAYIGYRLDFGTDTVDRFVAFQSEWVGYRMRVATGTGNTEPTVTDTYDVRDSRVTFTSIGRVRGGPWTTHFESDFPTSVILHVFFSQRPH